MPHIHRMQEQDLPWLDSTENQYLDGETLVVRLARGGFALDFRPSKQAQWRSPSLALQNRPPVPALLGEGGAVFFALEEGAPVGQVVVAGHQHRLARVVDLRVALARRKQGLGRVMMEAAERWAWQQGFVGLYMEVPDDNPGACQFCLRTGFRLGGVDLLRYQGLPGRIGGIDALCETALGFYRLFV